jgi:hypothetical protein
MSIQKSSSELFSLSDAGSALRVSLNHGSTAGTSASGHRPGPPSQSEALTTSMDRTSWISVLSGALRVATPAAGPALNCSTTSLTAEPGRFTTTWTLSYSFCAAATCVRAAPSHHGSASRILCRADARSTCGQGAAAAAGEAVVTAGASNSSSAVAAKAARCCCDRACDRIGCASVCGRRGGRQCDKKPMILGRRIKTPPRKVNDGSAWLGGAAVSAAV